MNSYPVFETERLWLRPTNQEDADHLVKIFNAPKALQFIGDRKIRTAEDALHFIENRVLVQLRKKGYGNFTTILKSTGDKVGVVGVYHRPGLTHPDLGYATLPEFEGRGLTMEAATVMVGLAKTHFGLEALSGITHPENAVSQKMLTSLGFAQVGTFEFPDAKWIDLRWELPLGQSVDKS